MTTVPTKIVLKSTTRMSLNDRFSNIAPSVQTMRANMASEQQVSAANRRLAQQLANRPGIPQGDVYAMQQQQHQLQQQQQQQQGMMRGGQNRMRGQQRPLQQRLGKANVKNRLTLPATGSQPIRGRGRGRGRGNLQQTNQQGGRGGNTVYSKQRGRGTFVPRGVRGRGRGRAGFNRLTGQNTTFVRRGRGNTRGFRGRGRGGRGRGYGRGGNQGGAVSQQSLDAQLDQYMAKTKSALDTELDAYMAQV